MLLNWNDGWELDVEQCSCDTEFIEWVKKQDLSNQKIFHMGTGLHHIVGKEITELNKDNLVQAITACPEEYKIYMQAVIDEPKLGWKYKPIFADIYQSDIRQFSSFNVVTLFHAYEFTNEVRTQGLGMSDKDVINMFVELLEPNGYILGYNKSIGFTRLNEDMLKLVEKGTVKPYEDYKSLHVWQKV